MAEFRVTFSQGASVYPGGKWSQRLGLEQGSRPRCGGKSAVVTPSQAHTSSQHAHEQNLSSCWNETVTQSEVWTQFDSEVTFSAMGTAQVSPARANGGQATHTAFAVWGGTTVGPPGQDRADVSPLSPGLGAGEEAQTGHKKRWLK